MLPTLFPLATIDQFAAPVKIYFTILHAVPLQFNTSSKGRGKLTTAIL